MKIKKGFELRRVGDENIIVAKGAGNIDFSRIISLNESAAKLWEEVKEKEFDADMLAELLLSWYDVSPERALADSEKLIMMWNEAGIAEA